MQRDVEERRLEERIAHLRCLIRQKVAGWGQRWKRFVENEITNYSEGEHPLVTVNMLESLLYKLDQCDP